MKKCLGCGKNNRRNVNRKRVTIEFVGAYCVDCCNKADIEPLDKGVIKGEVDRFIEGDRQRNIMKNRETRLSKKDYWQREDI